MRKTSWALMLAFAAMHTQAGATEFVVAGDKKYTGEVTLSGEYVVYNRTYSAERGELCFLKIDSADVNKIPRPPGDERDAWFCLDNKDLAPVYKDLQISGEMLSRNRKGDCDVVGKATIGLRGYDRRGDCHCSDHDVSTLTKVLKVLEPPRLECGVDHSSAS